MQYELEDTFLKYKKAAALGIGLLLFIGGCQNREDSEISVQDYTGQNFHIHSNGYQAETAEIAEAHRDEVEKTVKDYFLDQYRTKVKIHNIVGGHGFVTVYAESVGKLHFYTSAKIKIDLDKKEVQTDAISSSELDVKDSITSAIYALAFEDEFAALDYYLEKLTEDEPVVGKTQAAVDNTSGKGYQTPYYAVSLNADWKDDLYSAYLENPKRSKQDWQEKLEDEEITPKSCDIIIQLYMKKAHTRPSERIYNQVVQDIEDMEELAPGTYSIYLNDNRIDKNLGYNPRKSTLGR